MCFKHLFANEDFVMFNSGIGMTDHWDELLSQDQRLCDGVITQKLRLPPANTFVKIKSLTDNILKLQASKMYMQTNEEPVLSIVCCVDLIFCASSCASLCIADETVLGVSAILHHHAIKVFHPTVNILQYSCIKTVSQGVKCVVDLNYIKTFAKWLWAAKVQIPLASQAVLSQFLKKYCRG